MVNARQKGARGERDICDALNPIVQNVMRKLGHTTEDIAKAAESIQRNQNQSAVGGSDLTHTFGLSIEIKRQEQLSINTWWKQCTEAAKRNNEVPVLLYKQNHKAWRCITYGALHLPAGGMLYQIRMEFSWEEFLIWFENWVMCSLKNGEKVRV